MDRNILLAPIAGLLLCAACAQQESTAPSAPADREDDVSIDADVHQYPEREPGTPAPDRDTTINSDVNVTTPGTTSGSATPEPRSDTSIDTDVDVNTRGTAPDNQDTSRDDTATQDATAPTTNQ